MTAAHPIDGVDVGAAIAAMRSALDTGRHWDARAVRMHPDLADACLETRWLILDLLRDDDPSIPEEDEENWDAPLTGEASRAIDRWLALRAAHALHVLRQVPIANGRVTLRRAIRRQPGDVRPALGVHWSWDPSYGGGADIHWVPEDADAPGLLMTADAPIASVDWPTTLLCAMDHEFGDDERELRLVDGAPVRLTGLAVDGVAVDVPDRLRQGTTA